jgi:hypothetical protein
MGAVRKGMSGTRDFADVGRLRVVRWPVFVLLFNG